MTVTTTKSSYASTPSKFYVSEAESLLESTCSAQGNDNQNGTARGGTRLGNGSGSGKGKGDAVEIYSPESDTRMPHLISKNIVTYHTNFFEEPEGMEGLGRSDPFEVVRNGGGSTGVLSPVDFQSPDSDYHRHSPSRRNRSQSYSASRAKPVELEYYDIEGSWAWDASGRARYRGTGKIEEVVEVEEGGDMVEDPVLSPGRSSLEEEEELDKEDRLAMIREQFKLTSPLPPHITPPPRPRRVDEAILSPSGTAFSIPKTTLNSGGISEIGVGRGLLPGGDANRSHRVGLGVHLDIPVPLDLDIPMASLDVPPPPPPAQLPPPMREPEEPDLETQMLTGMLEWVKTGVEDIQVVRDVRVSSFSFLVLVR